MRIYDAIDGKKIRELAIEEIAGTQTGYFTPDSKRLRLINGKRIITEIDIETGKKYPTTLDFLPEHAELSEFMPTPDPDRLLLVYNDPDYSDGHPVNSKRYVGIISLSQKKILQSYFVSKRNFIRFWPSHDCRYFAVTVDGLNPHNGEFAEQSFIFDTDSLKLLYKTEVGEYFDNCSFSKNSRYGVFGFVGHDTMASYLYEIKPFRYIRKYGICNSAFFTNNDRYLHIDERGINYEYSGYHIYDVESNDLIKKYCIGTKIANKMLLNGFSGKYTIFQSDRNEMIIGQDGDRKPLAISFPVSSVPEKSIKPIKVASYPNPASSEIRVEFDSETTGLAALSIIDIYGNVALKMDNISISEGRNSLSLETASLAPGVYFMQLAGGTRAGSIYQTAKFVVAR